MKWTVRSLMFALSVVVVAATGISPAACGADQPNFVILFADDMGYGDLGCYGHPTIATPHLDEIARQGMKFTQFYVASSVCTPSRAGLLTGRLPIRSGLSMVLIPSSTGGMPAGEVTLAEALKDVGYATACIGKWHLGWQQEYLPGSHGFDRYFGIPYSNDMSPAAQPGNPVFKDAPPHPLIRDFTVTNPDHEPDQRLLTQQYTAESLNFIREYAGKQPFLLYLAHTMPHVPLYASAEFEGRSRRGLYGDTVEEIDWSCGEILAELTRLGIAENTLVIFTSDNGPWLAKGLDGGSAGPFFEGKVSTWEGGLRVPAIFRWPGRIPAGITTAAFGTTMDLYPTLINLAGGTVPTDRPLDGRDLSPVLFDNGPGRDAEMYYYFGAELWAVRRGPWKMHFKTTDPSSVQVWGAWEVEVHDPPLLFNVEHDPGEQHNVAAANPQVLNELAAMARQHIEQTTPGAPQR
ncbi:MAG: sulfatase [Planctomycetaceae bacterium]